MAGKSPKLGSKLSNGQHHHHQNGNGASSSSSVELQNLLEEETSLHEPQLQQQQSRKERSRLLSPIAVLFYLALWTLLMFTDSSPPPPPPIQYALMLDAGSSGSRIHIYKFKSYDDASGQLLVSPDLVDETFIPIKPGLSHFKDDPVAAAESLDQLLDKAVEQVPKELHAITPMALKATAGLRLIGEAKSNAILAQVRKHLSEKYPFPIADIKAPGVDGVSLMDGIDEGVYAWITVNYLSSRLGQSTKVPTIAIVKRKSA